MYLALSCLTEQIISLNNLILWPRDKKTHGFDEDANSLASAYYTHTSGGDPGALGLPPSILTDLRGSSYETGSVPRAISVGKEDPPVPLAKGEGFRVTATSRGSSDKSPPEPGRRAARRLFILRYLKVGK